jgi:type III secretion protein R
MHSSISSGSRWKQLSKVLQAILSSRPLLLALGLCLLIGVEAQAAPLLAQIPQEGLNLPGMMTQAIVLALLALSPFLVMLLTSYIKIIITMSLLRNALGVQQAPPNAVLNGIALIMSIYVMFPVGYQMYLAAKPFISSAPSELFSTASANTVIEALMAAKEPLRNFLEANTSASHQQSFLALAMRTFPPELKETLTIHDFLVVIPSFVTSQIRDAFEIGVLIYLPFFVIDLVVSNILLAMGMMMLSPMSIALPIKLLLLVSLDGWTTLIQGLVMSFRY